MNANINTLSVAEQIAAAEQQRCAAMLAGDTRALENILDDRLGFCHATGSVDSKDAYIRKVAAGNILYRSIIWSEQAITDLGGSAILTGNMMTEVNVAGTEKSLKNRVIAVWTVVGSGTATDAHWKLLAFQSTPLVQ